MTEKAQAVATGVLIDRLKELLRNLAEGDDGTRPDRDFVPRIYYEAQKVLYQLEAVLATLPESPAEHQSSLPKRTAKELAAALRARAGLLSGASWEIPATAAMMREAAEALLAARPSSTAD